MVQMAIGVLVVVLFVLYVLTVLLTVGVLGSLTVLSVLVAVVVTVGVPPLLFLCVHQVGRRQRGENQEHGWARVCGVFA